MKFNFLSVIFFITLLISCAQNQNFELANLNEDTLKNETARRLDEITWTRELESVRLIEDISKNAYASSSVKITPQIYTVTNRNENDVIPFLEGIGSLDTSSINEQMKTFLDSFCRQVKNWNISQSSFESDSIYSLVLFKYDVEEGWFSVFGENFPVSGDEENPESEKKDVQLFSDYIYSEPFFLDHSVQVAVRFLNSRGNLDVSLFLNPDDSYKISSIEILNMK